MLMATGVPLPADHPSVDPYVCNKSIVQKDICFNHPDVQSHLVSSHLLGYDYPVAHESLEAWASALPGYPQNHSNVDTLLHGGKQYGLDHPNMDKYVNRRSPGAVCYNFSVTKYPPAGVCPSGVPSWHPAIDASIDNPLKVYPAYHVRSHPILAAWMPADHRCAFGFVLVVLSESGLSCLACVTGTSTC